MTLLSSLLFKITSYCRCRIINGPDQTPYLERYHLFRLPLGYRVYLHRFVASDPGRGLHNHPWKAAFSLVLCGQYEEIRMAGSSNNNALQTRHLSACHLNWINGTVFHHINLIDNREAWTLFIHGPKAKSWGILQRRRQQYAFHDHNLLLPEESNPLWWKTANKPLDFPAMRLPANYNGSACHDTHRTAA